jgi:hypothetical protein
MRDKKDVSGMDHFPVTTNCLLVDGGDAIDACVIHTVFYGHGWSTPAFFLYKNLTSPPGRCESNYVI